MLWFGWFGFNGGSGFGANQGSVLAFTNTLLAPAATLSMWMILDLIRGRQVTAISAATAIIVGCVAITPAGGYVSPGWAIALGRPRRVAELRGVIVWRTRTRVDETLDVLAAHGIAGLTGILFIGFFAQASWNGVSDGFVYGNAGQLGWQALAAVAAPIYAFCMTFALLKLMALVSPLRGSERDEALGMDIIHHGEEAYATGEGAYSSSSRTATPAKCDDRGGRCRSRARHAPRGGRPVRATASPRSTMGVYGIRSPATPDLAPA